MQEQPVVEDVFVNNRCEHEVRDSCSSGEASCRISKQKKEGVFMERMEALTFAISIFFKKKKLGLFVGKWQAFCKRGTLPKICKMSGQSRE